MRPEGLGKFKNSPHRVSNPGLSGLQHSALTTALMRPEGLGEFKNSPHRVSNPGPSGLQHSALTTACLTSRNVNCFC
jgi:succinate-acetate transporter protein